MTTYSEAYPSVNERLAETLTAHNLHAVVAAGEGFAPYANATVDFFRLCRGPSRNVHSYVHDYYLAADDFRAALILDGQDKVVGTHWSERITRQTLEAQHPTLGTMISLELSLRARTDMAYAFGSDLLVHPELRCQGLAAGLRATTQMAIREAAAEPTMLVSLIDKRRGVRGDNASETSARRVGHMPTGIYRQDPTRSSRSVMAAQYWYGVLRPGQERHSAGNHTENLL